MRFTDEQIEKAAEAWEKRIIDIEETDEIICITYAIPTPNVSDDKPWEEDPREPPIVSPNEQGPTGKRRLDGTPIPGTSTPGGKRERRKGGGDASDIWEPFVDEIERRFGNGKMTVCHRKKREPPTEFPDVPLTPAPIMEPGYKNYPVGNSEEEIPNCGGWRSAKIGYIFRFTHFIDYQVPWREDEYLDEKGGPYFMYVELLNPIKIKKIFQEEQQIWAFKTGVVCDGWRWIPTPPGVDNYAPRGNAIFSHPTFMDWDKVFTGDIGSMRIKPSGERTWTAIGGEVIVSIELDCIDWDLFPQDKKNSPTSTNGQTNMNCCDRIMARLDDIERNIHRLMEWTGAATGGFEVPETLMDLSPGDDWTSNIWDALTPNAKRKINSMPDLWKWWVEKNQEQWGSWPAPFEDKDGNQAAYPNQAEAWKGMTTKMMKLAESIALIQYGLCALALEAGLTREQGILTTAISNAIADFLEIDFEDSTEKIQHLFSKPADQPINPEDVDESEEIRKFFEPTEFQVRSVKADFHKQLPNGHKPQTFGTTSKRILQIWESIQITHGVQVPRGDSEFTKTALKNALIGMAGFAKGKGLDGRPVSSDGQNDLSQWRVEVENQFATEENPPTNAVTEPWGGSTEERPNIIIRGPIAQEGDDM